MKDLLLNYNDLNEASSFRPVLIVHGLFGSSQNWQTFAKRLIQNNFRVITVDLRNHGNSFHHDVHNYEEMVSDLTSVIEKLGPPVDIIGHSMGGKSAMLLSCLHPSYVNKLAVLDIAPVKYTHSQLDKVLALLNVDLSSFTKRSDVDRILSKDIPDKRERSFLMLNLDRKDEALKWKINLNALRRCMPEIMDFPQKNLKFTKPSLFVSGSNSSYIKKEYLRHIKNIFPNYRLEVIRNSGHWIHADNPEDLFLTLRDFFLN